MIAKKFRLSSKKDFDKILKSRTKFYGNDFVLRLLTTPNNNSRFSIVVSKKISKKAVFRNLIRRRVYEVIRLNMEKIKPGYDIMVFAKEGALKMNYAMIEEELMLLFKKHSLLK